MHTRTPFTPLVLALAALLGGCSASGLFRSKLRDPEQVPAAIERAEEHLAAGRTREGLELLRDARQVEGLAPELRVDLDGRIERHADSYVAERVEAGRPQDLVDLLEWNLPAQIAVGAGVQAARLRLEQGRPYKAYRVLRKVEARYPLHHESRAAGALLAEAGLRLIVDDWSFLGFFRTRDDGAEVLEYLVVTYPAEPRCDEAYFALGEHYAADRRYQLARQRYEDLRLYHPASPLAEPAEALIPGMRLVGLESPEFDRRELLRARVELETFLAQHPESELLPEARLDLADCLHRLVLSDLGIAGFYRRVGRPDGARLHAQRALETAETAGDERLARRSRDLIASLAHMEEPALKQDISPPEPLDELDATREDPLESVLGEGGP